MNGVYFAALVELPKTDCIFSMLAYTCAKLDNEKVEDSGEMVVGLLLHG
jgi:hypothetical protein